jgi:hypothetical protein
MRNLKFFNPLSLATVAVVAALTACDDSPVDPDDGNGTPPPISAVALRTEGNGSVLDRFTGELWVVGNVAYTTTWGSRVLNDVRSVGNAVKIWDVSGTTPALIDSLIVADAFTLGDIQASDDGKLLIVATEFSPGSIVIYDLTNPKKPQLISRFTNANTDPGVHTAEVQRVNGKLYAFLCVDPSSNSPARLVIVDITNPAAPTQVFSKTMGDPYVHDVFVRDGILMAALWTEGMSIFDIGGGGKGGTVANPVFLGNVRTVGGQAHNIWWFHDKIDGTRRYAFVGEEGPGSMGSSSEGDIHVVDVSDFANPKEVAFYTVAGAGVHNFSADESRGVLFAAYYNGGVRALNVRGNLGECSSAMKSLGRCDLGKLEREVAQGLTSTGSPVFVWGVQAVGTKLYASDMLNGLWKLETIP